jgi:hypothetical protein
MTATAGCLFTVRSTIVTHWTEAGTIRRLIHRSYLSVTHKARVATSVKVIMESLRGTVAAAASVWENIYVDTTCIPDGLNTAPNVGDMFGVRQCCAARIGRAA